MSNSKYDIIIIGAGPAGLSAGIYSARAGLKTMILEKGIPGGTAAMTDLIENYPGFSDGIKGMELGLKMRQQGERFGVKIINAEARSIVKAEKGFIIKTSSQDYTGDCVIVATGSSPKALNIPGEKELLGRGVSYCATCDGPLFKNRDIAVIGCGNSGLQEGRFLLNFARSITFVEFLPYITADKILQEGFKDEKRVRFFLESEVLSIQGQGSVEAIRIRNRKTNKEEVIPVTGVFIYIGLIPNSQVVHELLDLDREGFIITNERLETSVPGIFAAGDVRAKRYRQIVIACSEGAIAALNAYHYLRG
ncbi:MAG: thioredoxin-disulfide reductase [candidate division WOR-3 bacterium]